MELRYLSKSNKNDMQQHKELMRYAFEPRIGNYVTSENRIIPDRSPETHLGVFDGENLVSSLIIVHFHQYIRGILLPMAGIAGVATKPEYRRKGLVTDLFEKTFHFCREKFPISSLYPFKFSYYNQFDYMWVDNVSSIKGKISSVKMDPVPDLTIVEEKDNQKAIERIKTIYSQFAENSNGLIHREMTTNTFERRFEKGFFFFIVDNSHTDIGYIVLLFEEDQVLHVREMVGLTKNARKMLWYFIKLHEGQREYFKIWDTIPHEIQTYPYLKEPRIEEYKLYPNSMLRIIDIDQALSKIPYPGIKGSESITFEVTDTLCGWNNGRWNLKIQDTKGVIIKEPKENPSISIDIKGLSQLLTGFRNTQELLENNLIIGDLTSLQALDNCLPKVWFAQRDWY